MFTSPRGMPQSMPAHTEPPPWVVVFPPAPKPRTPGSFSGAPSPRLRVQDVLRDAALMLRPTSDHPTSDRDARKGRPPPRVLRTRLDVDARAVLARITSDTPPGPGGWGGKMSLLDDSGRPQRLLSVFPTPSGTVPKSFLPEVQTTEEVAWKEQEKDIIAKVNESEDAAMDCLKGLISTAGSAVKKADAKEEIAMAKIELARLESESSASTVTPRRRRRNRVESRGSRRPEARPSDVANLADVAGMEEVSSSDEEEALLPTVAGPPRGVIAEEPPIASLVLPVVQGFLPSEAPAAAADANDDAYGLASHNDVEPAARLCHSQPGPSADRMQRLLTEGGDRDGRAGAQTAGAASTRRGGSVLGGGPLAEPLAEWPAYAVGAKEMTPLLRRVRFFKELPKEVLMTVAAWVEVQYVEPRSMLAEEGHWCHSFVMLYAGVLEASGSVYREQGPWHQLAPPPPPPKVGLDVPTTKGGGLMSIFTEPTAEEMAAEAKQQRVRNLASGHELPQPAVDGPHDSLQPILLHPGACFGEAAFATERLVHTCTVRTMQRCVRVLLVCCAPNPYILPTPTYTDIPTHRFTDPDPDADAESPTPTLVPILTAALTLALSQVRAPRAAPSDHAAERAPARPHGCERLAG